MLSEQGKIRFREVLMHLRGNLSQEEFSKRIGIGQSTLSGWENLKIDSPKLDHVERIAEEAGMEIDEFISFLYFGKQKPKISGTIDASGLSTQEIVTLQQELARELQKRI